MDSNKIRKQIIDHLTEYKGWCSIFWVTETQNRAKAFDSMEREGLIIRNRSKESGYPYMYYEIQES